MGNDLVGRPMEILLVEDGLLDARVTIEALKEGQIQHRLTLIRDGEEALEFLNQVGKFAKAPRPDLVLRPGLPVETFLRTEDRTPLSYLTQPLTLYLQRAFREE